MYRKNFTQLTCHKDIDNKFKQDQCEQITMK